MITALVFIFTLIMVASGDTVLIAQNLGQSKSDDSCSRLRSGDFEIFHEGVVIDVIDSNTIKVKLHDHGIKCVRLLGLDAPSRGQPFNKESRNFLVSIVSGKKVEIYVHTNIIESIKKKEFAGQAVIPSGTKEMDVGLEQMRAGLARYRDLGLYSLPGEDKCRYQKAEEEAKVARRGVWQALPSLNE